MSDSIEVGDVVSLKSGGPAMTVAEENTYEKGEYICIWFKGASKERGSFHGDILKSYEAPKK